MPADPFYVEQRLLLMATITIVRASRSLPGLTQLTFFLDSQSCLLCDIGKPLADKLLSAVPK